MPGIYLIDPDGKSGMLEDGTEFVASPSCGHGPDCTRCVGHPLHGNENTCMYLGQCWDFEEGKTWEFVRV